MHTTVRPCTCAHAWMDRIYGSGQRVMNMTKQAELLQKVGGWRCIVCCRVHPL